MIFGLFKSIHQMGTRLLPVQKEPGKGYQPKRRLRATFLLLCYIAYMKKVICFTSGKASGNPGPAAIGVYITDDSGAVIKEIKQSIGNSNSNFAEYNAVMLALQTLIAIFGQETLDMNFEICLDSELVKKQLNSETKINEPGQVPMFIEIHNMRVEFFPDLTFKHIIFAQNKEANRLVNEALIVK